MSGGFEHILFSAEDFFCQLLTHYIDDIYDKNLMFQIHTYLMNHNVDNKIIVSVLKRYAFKQIRRVCINDYNNNNSFIYKRTIQQAQKLNKNACIDYAYNEEHI